VCGAGASPADGWLRLGILTLALLPLASPALT